MIFLSYPIRLADKDAVLVDVAVVVSVRLIPCASLELVIVPLDMDVVGDFEGWIFPKMIKKSLKE